MIGKKLLMAAGGSGSASPTLVGRGSYGGAGRRGDIDLDFVYMGWVGEYPQGGDLVVVSQGIAGQGSNTSSLYHGLIENPGYTRYVDVSAGNDYSSRLIVDYKIMGSSLDTGVYIRTPTGGSVAFSHVIFVDVWRGFNTNAPFQQAATTVASPNTVNASFAGLSNVAPNSVCVFTAIGAHYYGTVSYIVNDLPNQLHASADDSYDTVGITGYVPDVSSYAPSAAYVNNGNTSVFSSCSCSYIINPAE